MDVCPAVDGFISFGGSMTQYNSRGTEIFLIVLLSMFLLMAYTIFRILPSPANAERHLLLQRQTIEHIDPVPVPPTE